MIKLYDVETARKTILRRMPVGDETYPPALLASLERLFGEALTPPQAVARILASVREEGDAALHRWTATLDKVNVDQFRIPIDHMRSAFEALPELLRQALTGAADSIPALHHRRPIP